MRSVRRVCKNIRFLPAAFADCFVVAIVVFGRSLLNERGQQLGLSCKILGGMRDQGRANGTNDYQADVSMILRPTQQCVHR